MIIGFSITIFILITIIIILLIKNYNLKKSINEISNLFNECVLSDTNTLISISSRDKYICKLATSINNELKQLRKQKQKFISGDKELKDAITNISHDLRTPLTAICGYLDLLKQVEKNEDVSRYISYIENRTLALKQLTEELFSYSIILSKNYNVELEIVNIKMVLEECISEYYEILKQRKIEPKINFCEENVFYKINKNSLVRVFNNIINNALKYSDGDLEIELDKNGKIIFTNTASKLNEVQVGKLFDRFFTVQTARTSTGLGLAISKTLVEQFNGTLSSKYENNKLSIIILFNKKDEYQN